jgi:predicted Ser/Thr protein kinase
MAENADVLFSETACARALERFPEGTLDLFQAADFSIDCTTLSLLDQLAKGSYGTVYKGSMAGSFYAVKIEDFHEEDEEQTNLIVELSLLASFPHPNLVKFYGAGCLARPSATGERVSELFGECC